MAQVKPINKNKMNANTRIAAIVAIVILLAFVVALIANSGIFMRTKTAVESENFEFSGSMLTYYTNLVFQSWYSNYYYYILLGYINFNPSLPLEEQTIKDTYGVLGAGSDVKTYYDYFYKNVKEAVNEVLLYCEAAKVDPESDYAKMEADAEQYSKDYVQYLKAQAISYGYTSFTTYIREAFGADVNENDIKKVQKLISIASTYATELSDRIYDNMTDDRKVQYFNDHFESFFKAEYLTFSVSYPEQVTYPKAEDYEGGEESAAYKAAVKAAANDKTLTPPIADDYVGGENSKAYQEAKKEADLLKAKNDEKKIADEAFIQKLASSADEKEFKKNILEYVFDEQFKKAYDTAVKNFKDEEKPSDEDLAAFKESVKQAIIDATLEGLTDIPKDDDSNSDEGAAAQDDNTTEDKTKKWKEAKEKLPASVITNLNSVLTSAKKTGSYSLNTDLGKKLFGGVKAEYGFDYESYETQGTNAAVGEKWYENTLLANKNSIEYSLTKYKAELAAETDETKKKDLETTIKTLEESLEDINETIADIETKTGYYAFAAYYVTEAAHREDANSRDVGHILFQVQKDTEGYYNTKDEAKAAAEKLLEEIKAAGQNGIVTKEVFESFAKDTHDSNVFYDDVCEGEMVEAFETWLFEATQVGSLGLVETEYGWHIMFYEGEGEAQWMEYAQDGATSEDLNEEYEKMEAAHTIHFNEELLAQLISGITQ